MNEDALVETMATRFSTVGLLSKWGFGDGDMLNDLFFDKLGMEAYRLLDIHEVLSRVVENHVVPELDQKVETVRIGTIHNPIRAQVVDGVDVVDGWLAMDVSVQLTPEFVDVPVSVILQTVREVVGEGTDDE